MTIKEVKKIIGKHITTSSLEAGFKRNGKYRALEKVYERTAELFEENQNVSKELYTHLGQILPCIAFYEELTKLTGNKEKALEVFEKWAFVKMNGMIPVMQAITKAGLYKKVPYIGKILLERVFCKEAGFEYSVIETENGFAADMTACPYLETCKKYSCPELTAVFCRSDDLMYGNLHPDLVWARTQTLGTGGECCDFRMYLK